MKKNTNIVLTLSQRMISAIAEHSNNRSNFIREAIAEKLARDFAIMLPSEDFRMGRGFRTDLQEPSAKKLALMRSQAEHARKSRWKK